MFGDSSALSPGGVRIGEHCIFLLLVVNHCLILSMYEFQHHRINLSVSNSNNWSEPSVQCWNLEHKKNVYFSKFLTIISTLVVLNFTAI